MELNRNKKIILMILAMILGVNLYGYINNNTKEIALAYNVNPETGIKELIVSCDYAELEYNELEDKAEIIALIKVKDNLSEKNSYFTYDNIEGKYLVGYYGERDVEVLKYYKSENQEAKKLNIIEPAAIKDNIYYHNEDYSKMVMGNEYIVYLSTENASGKYSIMAGSTGITKVNKVNEIEDYEDVTSLYDEEHNLN
ncbi:hypothetical protein [Candidatus Galacturonibacter soehngenii]|uniref:Uncharacterized protein n=1 Tax=Candidatus Galacturonatibacter soehngenii TaxID=2307010 RepID=A0A7V7QNP8_9FIRM|nr:hypothetical protein [Candidatus Galacturonibacter soehngenii]KAB1440694.1 hypothetical protein F7O84_02390 [Candidatus Galacturonibacter soehngenii]